MTTGLAVRLPHGWSWLPLKHATTYVNRGSAPDYVDDGPIRVLSQAANQADGFDWERTRFHSFDGDPRKLKGHLRSRDVLVNSTGTGTLGRVGFYTHGPDERPGIADGHLTVVRTDPDLLDPKFAYYWLSSQPFQALIYATMVAGATNQIELSRERLCSAPVPLPPLDGQRRIAGFLDVETRQIDALIAIRAKTLKLLDERVNASRCDCVSGRALPGPKRAVFPIGEVLASWDIVPLKRLVPRIGVGVVVNPSSYFADDGVPFIHGNNVRDGRFDLTDVKRISPNDSNALWRSRLSQGDVVVVRAGYPGRAAVVSQDMAGANCASVLVIKRGFHVLPEFVEAFFNSSLGQAQVNIVRYGAAQEQINVGHVVNFLMPAPPLKDQETQLALLKKRLGEATWLQAGITRQIDLLAERRQALITAAVTGQFDVSSASGRGLT